jgi:hypothetical protein
MIIMGVMRVMTITIMANDDDVNNHEVNVIAMILGSLSFTFTYQVYYQD